MARDTKQRLCVVSAYLLTLVLLTPATLRAQQVTPIDAVVTHVNVRANPPADTTRVGALKPDETAVLLDSIPFFYRVRLDNDVEGFVSKRWTRIIEESRVDFKIHFLDDGRGDVAIIDVGEHEIIVDGGFSTRVLHDYNRDNKVINGPIDLIIVTHAGRGPLAGPAPDPRLRYDRHPPTLDTRVLGAGIRPRLRRGLIGHRELSP